MSIFAKRFFFGGSPLDIGTILSAKLWSASFSLFAVNLHIQSYLGSPLSVMDSWVGVLLAILFLGWLLFDSKLDDGLGIGASGRMGWMENDAFIPILGILER